MNTVTGRRSASPRQDPRTGTWWFVADVGEGPDGKRRQARRRGFPTRKSAQAELDRLRVKATEGTYAAPKRQTAREFIDNDWLPAMRSNLEESTWASYGRYLRLHVVPALGSLQLSAVDPGHLNKLYASLLVDGRKDGVNAGLSPRSVRYVATILGKVFGDAVRWDRIARNPAERADPPRARDAKPKAETMRTWSAQQLESFLSLTAKSRYQPAWFFLATTGVRRGEALGLRWASLDLDTARASIHQTITAIEHRIKIGGKTKTGKARVIELDARTVAVLRSLRAAQAQERLLMGVGYQDSDLIFCHPDGHPYHPERFTREFTRMLDRLGLERIRIHDLRHTWATLALQAGVPLKVVSERLGHTTTAITADVYSHVTPGMQTDAAERVAALIFGGTV